MSSDKNMVMAAATLARLAPELWEQFVKAFGDYADDKIVECVSAQIDMLPVAQGRAQSLIQFGRLLEGCTKAAENITNRPPAKR